MNDIQIIINGIDENDEYFQEIFDDIDMAIDYLNDLKIEDLQNVIEIPENKNTKGFFKMLWNLIKIEQ